MDKEIELFFSSLRYKYFEEQAQKKTREKILWLSNNY